MVNKCCWNVQAANICCSFWCFAFGTMAPPLESWLKAWNMGQGGRNIFQEIRTAVIHLRVKPLHLQHLYHWNYPDIKWQAQSVGSLKKLFPWSSEKSNERNIYNIIVTLTHYMSSFTKGLSNEFGRWWRCAFRFRWQLGFKLTQMEQNIQVAI